MGKLAEIQQFVDGWPKETEYQPEYLEYLRLLLPVAKAAQVLANRGFDEADIIGGGSGEEWVAEQTALYEALEKLS